ncbi:MAG: hypothetical protein EOR86_15575 [Mesorhizobium sp.]|uniref:hypothetical protein n=1 Tax=Mesorhizobium sp. TaxID=1871066 RepID=UPI000FE885A7|nr:hypothetical protein [Mesorhizobium sp.]RWM94615.1 MAG: hypothetical protein EOR86_15575 [Mesorhizobium sp.]
MTKADDPKPHLRLAVENSQTELDRKWAKGEIEWPLRDLASNIIRVVRGAGKSYEIVGQCVAVIKAYQQYRETIGCLPDSWEIDRILSIQPAGADGEQYGERWEREHARETIVRGSLQIAASRLAGQNTQEQRGRSEMMSGVNDILSIREEARKRTAEAERAQRRAAANAAGRKKTKPRKRRKVEGDPEINL